jgi:COP9 signalosome complex subunit 3
MDAVTATLAAFAPTEVAAHSLKKYDAAIKDHVGAVKSLLTNQRQIISANTGEILQVYPTSHNTLLTLNPLTYSEH